MNKINWQSVTENDRLIESAVISVISRETGETETVNSVNSVKLIKEILCRKSITITTF
jgi:hypothetical protein